MSPLLKRPFYQSTQLLTIDAIDKDKYASFAINHFARQDKLLSKEVFERIYEKFDGHTWYIQNLLNRLYSYYRDVDMELVEFANNQIISEQSYSYADLLKACYKLPAGSYFIMGTRREIYVAFGKSKFNGT